MSQFLNKKFDAANYDSVRPKYPKILYDRLMSYHEGDKNLLVDAGCGPGTATFQMFDLLGFKNVIGTDLSKPMVDNGNKQCMEKELTKEKIEFIVSSGDDFSFLGNNEKADMITSAEAVHWFGFCQYQEAAYKYLRKNGTIALWGYVDPIVNGYPIIGDIIADIFYNDDKLGPFWTQPGRSELQNLFKPSAWDKSKYKDIIEINLHPNYYGKDASNDALYFKTRISVREYAQYLTSTSSYQTWKEKNDGKLDLSEYLLKKTKEAYPKFDVDEQREFVFNTYYKFARRI